MKHVLNVKQEQNSSPFYPKPPSNTIFFREYLLMQRMLDLLMQRMLDLFNLTFISI